MFHPISKQREVYIKHENELSKHQEVICQTGEEIFHLISKQREVTNLTREGVFYLYPNTEKNIVNTRRSVSSDIKIPRIIYPNTTV